MSECFCNENRQLLKGLCECEEQCSCECSVCDCEKDDSVLQLELWPAESECSCVQCTCDESLPYIGHFPLFGEVKDSLAKECTCVVCDCEECHNEEEEDG